jgi:hypothetical protein
MLLNASIPLALGGPVLHTSGHAFKNIVRRPETRWK